MFGRVTSAAAAAFLAALAVPPDGGVVRDLGTAEAWAIQGGAPGGPWAMSPRARCETQSYCYGAERG